MPQRAVAGPIARSGLGRSGPDLGDPAADGGTAAESMLRGHCVFQIVVSLVAAVLFRLCRCVRGGVSGAVSGGAVCVVAWCAGTGAAERRGCQARRPCVALFRFLAWNWLRRLRQRLFFSINTKNCSRRHGR